MSGFKNWLRITALLMSGLLSACNLWGTTMKATNFFDSEQVELLRTIQNGDEAKARQLLEQKDLSLNVRGKEGITPLFWLIMQQDHAAVELALRLGANPDFPSEDGRYPVATIAGGNDDDLLKILLEHGADPNVKDLDGKPALFGAIGQERWPQIKMLLEYGADPDLTDGPDRTSVQYASYLNKFEIAHHLITQGADYANRDSVGSSIAWEIHHGLSKDLLNPEFPAYDWALKVKEQLKERGVEFPPPSPQEVRKQRERDGRP
ncbi:MAG: hypothetical protein R6W87_03390 [Halospina sp.]